MTGRPHLSKIQIHQKKELMLLKLEPYLKAGYSVNKSLKQAKVNNAEFYKYMRDDLFREKIQVFRQYLFVLVNQSLFQEFILIINKQNQKIRLNNDELDFLWKYLSYSDYSSEEWGRRNTNVFDPHIEIKRVKRMFSD